MKAFLFFVLIFTFYSSSPMANTKVDKQKFQQAKELSQFFDKWDSRLEDIFNGKELEEIEVSALPIIFKQFRLSLSKSWSSLKLKHLHYPKSKQIHDLIKNRMSAIDNKYFDKLNALYESHIGRCRNLNSK